MSTSRAAHARDLLRAECLAQKVQQFARTLDNQVRGDAVIAFGYRFDGHPASSKLPGSTFYNVLPPIHFPAAG
jgi:hypothetical protein